MFSHISFESFHARLTGRALWIEQGLQITFYLSEFCVSVGLNPCDIRAVIAQQFSDLRMSRYGDVFGRRREHDDPVNPIRLFVRKMFCPIKKSAHGEQS